MIVRDVFGVGDVGPREVGIEIEMEGRGLHRLFDMNPGPNYWNVMEDGSLRGEAVELVLKKPCARNLVASRLSYLQKYLSSLDMTLSPSDRCGVHVHVNCQPLEITELYRFITLYLIFEDVLVNWCGEDRVGNLFCLRARDASGLLMALISAKKSGYLMDLMSNEYRYAAMNVTALRKYGSLEFRAMRSPAKFDSINNWVEALLNIKDYALSVESDRAFVEALSFNGGERFAAQVLKEQFENFKCPKMDALMLDGARAAQHLAYTNLTEPAPMAMKKRAVPILPPVWALEPAAPENNPDFRIDGDHIEAQNYADAMRILDNMGDLAQAPRRQR